MELKVPSANHGRLLVPDCTEIPAAVERNREIFARADVTVAGIPLMDFRARVRDRLKRLIGTREEISRPVLMVAHQPGFWHPGVMYKNTVARKFVERYFLIHVNVDSDVIESLSCKVPYAAGDRLGFSEIVLVPNEGRRIIEKLEKPPKTELDAIFAEIEEKVAGLSSRSVLESFRRFLEFHDEVYDNCETLSKWLTECRRRYYPVPGLHEVELSDLCSTEEFRIFAWDIINNCQRFFEIYNSCLDEYRAAHKIRYSANPFPNLEERSENHIELPFWLINEEGQRVPMFVACSEKYILATEDEILVETLNDASDHTVLENYQIRPKAVLLTMFMRMFASSIFIHGVSGGNYDAVTDAVIREYYGCRAPAYIVASCTECLAVQDESDVYARIEEARTELRNMKFNPNQCTPPGNSLTEEKRKIISASGQDTTKEQYRRLKEIREILVKEIADVISAREEELERLNDEAEKIKRVRRRDFPYFFYPLEALGC